MSIFSKQITTPESSVNFTVANIFPSSFGGWYMYAVILLVLVFVGLQLSKVVGGLHIPCFSELIHE